MAAGLWLAALRIVCKLLTLSCPLLISLLSGETSPLRTQKGSSDSDQSSSKRAGLLCDENFKREVHTQQSPPDLEGDLTHQPRLQVNRATHLYKINPSTFYKSYSMLSFFFTDRAWTCARPALVRVWNISPRRWNLSRPGACSFHRRPLQKSLSKWLQMI